MALLYSTRTTQKVYTTRKQQSVYDLAVQLYGSISNIGNLLKLFPNLDNEIPLGSKIIIEEQADPIAKFFLDRKIIVCTDLEDSAAPAPDGIYDYTYDTTYE